MDIDALRAKMVMLGHKWGCHFCGWSGDDLQYLYVRPEDNVTTGCCPACKAPGSLTRISPKLVIL